jgi:hypothetical protein
LSAINFSDGTPSAQPGGVNVRFQADTNGNISAYTLKTDITGAQGVMVWVPYTTTGQAFAVQNLTRDGDWTMVANKATTTRPAPQPSGNEEDLLPVWTPNTPNARLTYTVYNEWTISTAGWIDQYGVDILPQNTGATHTITLTVNGVVKSSFTAVPSAAGSYWHDITPIVVLSGAVLRVTLQVTLVGNNQMFWHESAGLFATPPVYCSLAVGSKDGAAAGTTAYGCHLRFIPGAASPDWDIVAFGGEASAGGGGAVTSVFGRFGDVIAAAGDYTAAQITNAVDATGSYSNPAWLASLAYSKLTGAPAGYVLPPATATLLGGVKIGANVSVAADGTISVAAPGGSQTPWTQNIDGGNHDLTNAGNIALNGRIDAGSIITAVSALSLKPATGATSSYMTIHNSPDTGNSAYVVIQNGLFGGDGNISLVAYTTGTPAIPITRLQFGDYVGTMTGIDFLFAGVVRASVLADGSWNSPLVNAQTIAAGNNPLSLNTSGTPRIYVTAAGNVGIGTSVPTNRLHVSSGSCGFGSATSSAVFAENSGSNFYEIACGGSGNYAGLLISAGSSVTSYIQDIGGGTFQIATKGAEPIQFLTNNAERMRISAGGSVGIGTTTPGATLDVQVQVPVAGTYPHQWWSTSNSSYGLKLRTIWDANGIYQQFAQLSNGTEYNALTFLNGFVGLGMVPGYRLQLSTDSAAKPSTATWTVASDIRLKRNAHPLEGGLDIIRALEVIEAEYNGEDATPKGARVVSFDAAKVRELVPHAVTSHKGRIAGRSADVLDLNIHEILMHLILAVQQLGKKEN